MKHKNMQVQHSTYSLDLALCDFFFNIRQE